MKRKLDYRKVASGMLCPIWLVANDSIAMDYDRQLSYSSETHQHGPVLNNASTFPVIIPLRHSTYAAYGLHVCARFTRHSEKLKWNISAGRWFAFGSILNARAPQIVGEHVPHSIRFDKASCQLTTLHRPCSRISAADRSPTTGPISTTPQPVRLTVLQGGRPTRHSTTLRRTLHDSLPLQSTPTSV